MAELAGGLLFSIQGKLGFFPKTNWFGLKPCTFVNAFFALRAQPKATSNEHLQSSKILLITSLPDKEIEIYNSDLDTVDTWLLILAQMVDGGNITDHSVNTE